MNMILLLDKDFTAKNRVTLHGRRYQHAIEVLKVTAGKELQVGLLNRNRGIGTVRNITDSVLDLDIVLDKEPAPPLPVNLIIALPRPKVFKRVLQGITTLGVKKIYILNSWRVDKSYWQSPVLEPSAIHETLILGLEQACDTMLPEVHLHKRFKPFIEDILPELAIRTCGLLAHPGSTEDCPTNLSGPVTLAVGPEGGFTPYEVDKMIDAGLKPVKLGCRPLRVETAVSALIGRLMSCP